MKRPGFAFVHRPFPSTFTGWEVVVERARPPRYFLSEVRGFLLATRFSLVEVSKATAVVIFWSTDFLLVAA